MAMLRPKGKAQKIQERVLKNKGVKAPEPKNQRMKAQTPYLQH